MAVKAPRNRVRGLLPAPDPVRFLAEDGSPVKPPAGTRCPPMSCCSPRIAGWWSAAASTPQATALTKQGRLAVYPSSRGQDACEVAAVLALRDADWLFPTYRDTMALVARGLDPVEVLTLLRGDWHCGYDPNAVRTAPQCTPLATQALHATGMAEALRRKGEDAVALALIGDGGTSEGDFHEALNFAAVFKLRSSSSCRTTSTRSRCRSRSRAPLRRWRTRGSATACVPSRSTATTCPRCSPCSQRPSSTHAAATGRRSSRRTHTAWRRTRTPTTPPATASRTRSTLARADPLDRLTTYLRGRSLLDDGRGRRPRRGREVRRRPAGPA